MLRFEVRMPGTTSSTDRNGDGMFANPTYAVSTSDNSSLDRRDGVCANPTYGSISQLLDPLYAPVIMLEPPPLVVSLLA